ncbi:MAG TPA: CHAT domain-containing protein [Pyrinomonadaceae bacterium]|nr:CHAT domain-containing protein [Pyrinomonadaceae bacterium]
MAENELIDEYARNTITADERKKLEQRLLRSKEQRQKLAFAMALDAEVEERAKVVPLVAPKPKPKSPVWFNPQLKIAAGVIIAVGLGIALWLLLQKSDVEKGMIALNQAQGSERLIQSRISQLNYAELRTVRGNETPQLKDTQARDYSERLFRDSIDQKQNAESYHALGRLYLAERSFDKAREQFQKALAKDQNDPQLQSDMGAALLELAGQSADEAQKAQYLGEAAQYLDRALQLNPSLPEALFNRALVYQRLHLPQAKDVWRKYLEIDSTSPWAKEAERNLKELETQNQKAQARRTDLHDSFLAAYRARDPDAAWMALKQSRSRAGNFILEKLLDQYLSFKIAGQQKEAAEVADELSFAADIESRRVSDLYTSDLLAFYRQAGNEEYPELARARQLVSSAREQYDQSEFGPSITLLNEARTIFMRLGDEPEAFFAENWIGYNELRSPNPGSRHRFEQLVQTYSTRSYQTLLAQSMHALSDVLSQKNEYSKVLDQAGRALAKAEQIEDDETRLRCLQQFLSMNLQLGNYQDAMSYGSKGLAVAPEFATEPKLIWTFYQEMAKAFSWLNLSAVAVEFQQEALRLANVAQWPFIITRSYTQLGIIHEQRKEFAPAIQAGLRAIEEGQKIKDQKSRFSAISHAHLRLAHIYREAGDPANALSHYDRALAMFDQLGLGTFRYEAHKGKFVTYVTVGDASAAQRELDTALDLFEEFRAKIHEERNRNAFFDAGQDIYDLAIDFALSRLNDKEKAFNYAEDSRARALLDLIHTAPQLVDKGHGPDIQLAPGVDPEAFALVRDSIPGGVTVVEYAMLEDKLIIWVAARGKLEVEVKLVTAADLSREIVSYATNLAHNGDATAANDAAVNLYRTLIEPVEKFFGAGDELCIVPDKALSSLPFAALRSPRTNKFLMESHCVLVSPSINVFLECTREAARKEREGAESILSVGNPDFSRRSFPNLADLPSAAREAEEVAASYKSEPLLGSKANETQVRARLPQADVIHFAAHYVVNPQSPMISALLLSQAGSRAGASHEDDGLLQAYEIYAMKLRRTRLAVLSACETGLERSYQGEGAIGIARSFLSAQVPIVVASLWPVDSDATAPLMIKFHEYRSTHGLSSAEALRRAQRDMLSAADDRLHQPYAWAGFVVYGGHASF